MKQVYAANDVIEAKIVAGMLQANGIEAHVGGYYLQGGIGELAAHDFANVQVADEDVELAASIIQVYEAENSHVETRETPHQTDSRATDTTNTKSFMKVVLFVLVMTVIIYFLAGR